MMLRLLCIAALLSRVDGFSSTRPVLTASSKSSPLFMIRKGRANSKEEDLERTIKLIMEHVKKDAKRTMNKIQNEKSLDLPSIIQTEEVIGGHKAANKVLGITEEEKMPIDTKDKEEVVKTSTLDAVLAKLTSLFPFFVFGSAVLGLKKPETLLWVNKGQLIPLMLAAVMVAMGMTLKTEDFTRVFKSDKANTEDASIKAIPAGISCQYIIMPLTAFLIGSLMLLPNHPAAFLGLILVGCSPGGTASNLVALIADADVALSVILTSISTIMASVMTPVLVKTLVGSSVSISGMTLCKATAQVVLLPVALGMLVREKIPKLADFVSRYASFAGVVLVSLLCGGVVASNAALAASSTSNILKLVIISVLGLHSVGFGAGYFASKNLFGLSEKSSRTISIETGKKVHTYIMTLFGLALEF